MNASTNKPVLVVGGGIGGLAAALALSRKGIPVQVLEQAPEFKEIGAGIQLGPNVFRMFEVLGLTEGDVPLGGVSGGPGVSRFDDRRNHRSICRSTSASTTSTTRPTASFTAPTCSTSSIDACKQSNLIKLATSQKVVVDRGRRQRRHRAGPKPARRYKGAALIGCDGLWSTVREMVVGDGKPVVSGHIAYRAVLPTAEWPKEYRLSKMIVWCGEKTHLVHYPLRRGELFNLVAVFHSDRYEEGWDTYGDPAELHARFAEKCEPVRTLLKKVNAWKMWVLCDRPPIKELEQGPHHAARRRRAPDAAVSRAGRQHGARGRGLPRQPDRGARAATTKRRSRNTRSCAICAPRACS